MSRPLRIGINALYLIPGGVGGTEIYLRSLLRAMASLDSPHEFFIYTNLESGDDLTPRGPAWKSRCLSVKATFRPGRLIYEQARLPSLLRNDRADVLLNPGFTAPARPGVPQVTVFHDLQHKRHPEYFRWFDLPAWEFFLWLAVKRSQRIIGVSESTRLDLLRFYRLPPERVVTVWSGVDEVFFSLQCDDEQKGQVLLCASTTHPHKNHERLLRVFARLRTRYPGWKLMLTGVRGFADAQVTELIAKLDLQQDLVLTGWVPREQLFQLYRQARAFVYPSTFEGFGLPVLESMAAGIPTACSRIEPLNTLAGEAAELFDPASEEDLEQALSRVMADEDTRARLAVEGPIQARRFSWTSAARQTLSVLESVAG